MFVYADNAATTCVSKTALDAMMPYLTEQYGNPSSLYAFAQNSKEALENARKTVADIIGAQPKEIYFTSGGSEADNQAIVSMAKVGALKGKKHLISTKFEHHAVLHTLKKLEKEGFEVMYVQPEADGNIPKEKFDAAIDAKTILVSVMAVNNETGVLLPLKDIAGMIKRKKAPALFHTDAVQGFCKIPLQPKKLGVDLISVSGHKVHAPKGVGALYVKSGVRILPHSFGGGQEKNLRPGTEGVPQICAFGEAVKHMMTEKEALTHVKAVQAHLIERLKAMPEVVLNSPENALPYIVNLSAGRVRAETMLHFLAERNIFVSSGSACGKAKPSHVLSAMQLPKERVETSLRISLSAENTAEEMDAFADALKEGLQTLSHA